MFKSSGGGSPFGARTSLQGTTDELMCLFWLLLFVNCELGWNLYLAHFDYCDVYVAWTPGGG